MPLAYLPAAALTLGLATLGYVLTSGKKGACRLPPSPKGDPIIGHIRILPPGNEHVAYKSWGDELKSECINYF